MLTAAREGKGIDDLVEAIGEHREWLAEGDRLMQRRRARLRRRIVSLVNAAIRKRMMTRGEEVERMVNAVLSGEETPRRAADRILTELSL